jgi:phytoene dehydrogenase-like protein
MDADIIIYCADLFNLLGNLTRFPILKNQQEIFKRTIVPPLLAFYIGLDFDVRTVGLTNYAYGITIEGENEPMDITFSSNIDPTSAPKGKTNVLASYFSPKQYDVKKMEEFTMSNLSKLLGMKESELKDKTEVFKVIAPKEFERMTLNVKGSFGGFQYTNYNAIKNIIPQETLVKNLFLAGQWVGGGAGYENTIKGGIDIATRVMLKVTSR